jgi:hypothetical protein
MVGESIILFLEWYFLDFPKAIFGGVKNFLKFGLHYFSIPFLLKTLFSHWHKYCWNYPKKFDIAKIFEVWISNQISRLIGAIARSFLIIVGLIYEILIFILGILTLFLWFSLPIIWFFILIYGIEFLSEI